MVEFNHTLLASLMLSGYKYMIYVGRENHAILQPLKTETHEIVVAALKGWQVPIIEREIQEMANGEDLIDFKFYIEESFFIEN